MFQFSGVYGRTEYTYSHMVLCELSPNLVELSAGVNLFSCDCVFVNLVKFTSNLFPFLGPYTADIPTPPVYV